MMRTVAGLVTAALLACGCASAQQLFEPDLPDDLDKAFAASREPYRGHAPYAVAVVSPFNEDEWFVLAFFQYWTGYSSTGDAKDHYFLRRVSGSYSSHGSDGIVHGEPAHTTWAVTDTCPELQRAVDRFEIHERSRFTNSELPPPRPGAITLTVHDETSLLFWASLDVGGVFLEINLLTPYHGDSGVAAWVKETVEGVDRCFAESPPDVPGEKPTLDQKPFSIFDLVN